jgi:hypothetical protein
LTSNGERRGGQRLEQREDRKLVQKIQEGLKRLAELENLPGASSFRASLTFPAAHPDKRESYSQP